jgi:hypothetical protein
MLYLILKFEYLNSNLKLHELLNSLLLIVPYTG